MVHSGIKKAGNWFISNVLTDLIEFCRKHNKQNLVLTGHSLGGATASMLTMMIVDDHLDKLYLNNTVDNPINLVCYAFAPPPVASFNIAVNYKQYINSYVTEDDAACRCSYGHFCDLRIMITCAVELARKNMSQNSSNFFSNVCPCCTCLAVSFKAITDSNLDFYFEQKFRIWKSANQRPCIMC